MTHERRTPTAAPAAAHEQASPRVSDLQPAPRWSGRMTSPGDLLALQHLAGNGTVARLLREANGDEALPGGQIGIEGGPVPSELAGRIESKRGAGRSVDERVSQQVGSALGSDVTGVRVHTDQEADSLNRSLTAKAFTTGSDIFFSHGSYRPGTPDGDQLIAHELTHVVQQRGGSASGGPGGLSVGRADDPLETEADHLAEQILQPSAGSADEPAVS